MNQPWFVLRAPILSLVESTTHPTRFQYSQVTKKGENEEMKPITPGSSSLLARPFRAWGAKQATKLTKPKRLPTRLLACSPDTPNSTGAKKKCRVSALVNLIVICNIISLRAATIGLHDDLALALLLPKNVNTQKRYVLLYTTRPQYIQVLELQGLANSKH